MDNLTGGKHFNTSHVSINPAKDTVAEKLSSNFNTSHVSINPEMANAAGDFY